MKKTVWCVLIVALLAAACGGDDDDSSSAAAGVSPSCGQLCTAQEAGGCSLGGVCASLCDAFRMAPANCQAAFNAVNDCYLRQPDVCMTGNACQAESDRFNAACTM